MASYRQKKKNIKKKLAAGQALTQEQIKFMVKNDLVPQLKPTIENIKEIYVDTATALVNASIIAAQGIEKICSAIKAIQSDITKNLNSR